MMDDIIDPEMEKIDKIIEKIKSDPETDEVKCTELNLWYKIQKRTFARASYLAAQLPRAI